MALTKRPVDDEPDVLLLAQSNAVLRACGPNVSVINHVLSARAVSCAVRKRQRYLFNSRHTAHLLHRVGTEQRELSSQRRQGEVQMNGICSVTSLYIIKYMKSPIQRAKKRGGLPPLFRKARCALRPCVIHPPPSPGGQRLRSLFVTLPSNRAHSA